MLANLGLTVARQIPADLVPGILSGAYAAHGGVIRDGLGRIVGHLAMAAPSVAPMAGAALPGLSPLLPALAVLGPLVNAGQLFSLGQDVEQVQQTVNSVLSLSMAGTALSGLGLVTSVVGFAYLSRRMSRIDAKLSQLEKQIKEVRILIQSDHKARLHAAIDCLRQSELTSEEGLRRELLMQSKSSFTTLAHYYREVWSNGVGIDELDAVDEYFTLAFTGAALATSELGMGDVASTELRRHFESWKVLARGHCGKQLLGDDPGRLMDEALVSELPARELADMLDFVNASRRGIDWIDDLRRRPASFTGRFQRLVAYEDVKPRIQFARRLRSRESVLSANVAHFDFLAGSKISAKYFADAVSAALNANGGEPICIHKAS